MIIRSIDLQNFRNYKFLHMDFDEKTNILYGDNAQGKTNILESIYLSVTTKSHRGSRDSEMISFGEEEAHIKTIVTKKNIDYRIDMHLKKNKSKGIAINGVPIKKSIDLYGIINTVLFSPEDLGIIKNGPAGRRRFMDMELCQLDRIYVNSLVNYNKAVDQRNRLLKDAYYDKSLLDTIEIWDLQLVKYGSDVIKIRRKFVSELNEIIKKIHARLTGNIENLIVEYEPSVNEDEFLYQLEKSRERDIRMKMTSYGPHRDDISFLTDGIDIRKYGSQGQQRTTALSLKLAEIELVKSVTGDTPILLLDDVLSELDSNRQNYLLGSIDKVQTVITCTGLDEFINNRFSINRVFRVSNGKVNEENESGGIK